MDGMLSSLWGRLKVYKQLVGGPGNFAGRCLVCAGETAQRVGLCDGCHGDLPRRKIRRLRRQIDGVTHAFAAFEYDFPIKDLIKAAKFQRDFCALGILKACLVEELAEVLEAVDLVIPVPLSRHRFVARGFNQSSELALVLAQALVVPVRGDYLRKTLSTPAQSLLSATARRTNLSSAFHGASQVRDAIVLVIDDVVTTGTTLASVASALRAAGAREIRAATLAATRLRGSD